MLLKVTNLWVDYEGALALRNVSVEVPEYGVRTILGPNGAGKSTLLRAIVGLKRPSSGEVWFGGEQLAGKSPISIIQIGIKYCPQEKRLFPSMSVWENLMTGAYLRRDRIQVQRDLKKVYGLFPRLEERVKQKAGRLSGGEQQMLSIGRAIMSNPKLLMLDEPTLGLSPMLVEEISHIITSVSQSGMSIILAEQNAIMALEVAQYAYVLDLGEIKIQGPSSEVKANKDVQKGYLGGTTNSFD